MKLVKLTIGLFLVVFATSCNPGLVISETKVPYKKICGSNSKYRCRATGFGSNNPTTRVYRDERPNGAGKGSGSNYFHLGRAASLGVMNDTYWIIDLLPPEISIDTTRINYDLKKDNITKIIAELRATLKRNNVEDSLATKIEGEFNSNLNNYLRIESNIITFTLSQKIIDRIREVSLGRETEQRFKDAYARLEGKDRPMIREVVVIQEICDFNESKDISLLLRPILRTYLGENDQRINLVVTGTLSRNKTSSFSTSYERTSIYSYGFWNDKWMFGTG